MTDEIELNKYLHELVGLCRHEWRKSLYQYTWQCSKCGLTSDELPLQFHFLTWDGFGIAWEFMQKHNDWEDFWDFLLEEHVKHLPLNCKPSYMEVIRMVTSKINPRELVEAVVRFFEEAR